MPSNRLTLFYADAGVSLESKLLESGKLPLAQTRDIVRQILRALAHCHIQGITHRNLKPKYVMLQDKVSGPLYPPLRPQPPHRSLPQATLHAPFRVVPRRRRVGMTCACPTSTPFAGWACKGSPASRCAGVAGQSSFVTPPLALLVSRARVRIPILAGALRRYPSIWRVLAHRGDPALSCARDLAGMHDLHHCHRHLGPRLRSR